MEKNKKNNWYSNLISETNSLAEELGLDDFNTGRLRDFIVDHAKSQYKLGNKNGAGWAFAKAREEHAQKVAVAA